MKEPNFTLRRIAFEIAWLLHPLQSARILRPSIDGRSEISFCPPSAAAPRSASPASVFGDYAEVCTSGWRKRKLKSQSIRLLFQLTLRLRGKDPRVAGIVRNEYYFQTGQYDSQYRLGVAEVRKGLEAGFYSQGVGAAWLSSGRSGRRVPGNATPKSNRAITIPIYITHSPLVSRGAEQNRIASCVGHRS